MRWLPLILVLCSCAPTPGGTLSLPGLAEVDETPTPPRFTPRWAYLPWISKDISSGADTRAFVDGFTSRDIPVGAVVLDSPWETHYNTFIPNEARYPDLKGMVKQLEGQGIRTVLWITQMVNFDSFDAESGGDTYAGSSPNYLTVKNKGYAVNEAVPTFWWKGRGIGLDFFNPEAVRYFHTQQQLALDLGIHGWKLDFGEDYLDRTRPIRTKQGEKTLQEYSEAYYFDFLAYGRLKRGREFLTMSRPYDKSYGFEGRFYARKEHCPVGWVGDNRRDWVGLIDALDHLFRSAQAGYATIGSDIGGYLDFDDLDLTGPRIPFSQANFARWVAMGALTPFMQLHGRGNFSPWTVPERVDETVALYRYWAKLHTALVPYLASLSEETYLGGPTPMRPLGEGPAQWAGDWRYLLGDSFLVAPILDDTGVRDVALPAGSRWLDWWNLDGPFLEGGQTLAAYDATDRKRIPLFLREGALVPLDVVDAENALGTAASRGKLTVLAVPGPTPTRFVLHLEEQGSTRELRLSATTLVLAEAPAGAVVKLLPPSPPRSFTVNGAPLPPRASQAALDASDEGFFAAPGQRAVWLRVKPSTGPVNLAWGL